MTITSQPMSNSEATTVLVRMFNFTRAGAAELLTAAYDLGGEWTDINPVIRARRMPSANGGSLFYVSYTAGTTGA